MLAYSFHVWGVERHFLNMRREAWAGIYCCLPSCSYLPHHGWRGKTRETERFFLCICRCSNMGPRRHIITYYLHLWLKHTFKLQLHPLLSLPLAFHFIPLQRLLCNSVLQLRQLCSLYTSLSFLFLSVAFPLSFISQWKKWDRLTAWEVFGGPIYYLVQLLSAHISSSSHAHIWRGLVKQKRKFFTSQ